MTDAFPAGFSTDNGWTWQHFPADGVFAGSVFGPVKRTATTVDIDLGAQSASAGLDERTGAVLWRSPGTIIGCAENIPLRADPVRCRVRGRGHFVVEPPASTFEGLDVALEGFDPRTGQTRWSVPAGRSEQLVGQLRRAAVAGDHTVVAELVGGSRMIDLTDGTVTVPAETAVFWCLSQARFFFREGHTPQDSHERFDRVGGSTATACGADGKPAGSGQPAQGASRAVGAVANGYAVVATPDGYRGIALDG
ncbi:hypothetical protein AB0G04_44005 [Actinoplanes sp. NPDC023801]|uniref:hypothetical protein n=1 Tax=Actinoplanes sp. NPDC023801 TaxID=3154595 RepID=UPI0033CA34D0